jgi:hypothetical protein
LAKALAEFTFHLDRSDHAKRSRDCNKSGVKNLQRNIKPLILLAKIKIGAGEGNRTLVTTKVVLSGIKWPSSLGNSIVV